MTVIVNCLGSECLMLAIFNSLPFLLIWFLIQEFIINFLYFEPFIISKYYLKMEYFLAEYFYILLFIFFYQHKCLKNHFLIVIKWPLQALFSPSLFKMKTLRPHYSFINFKVNSMEIWLISQLFWLNWSPYISMDYFQNSGFFSWY